MADPLPMNPAGAAYEAKLVDKLRIAFDRACDQGEYALACKLLDQMDRLITRLPEDPEMKARHERRMTTLTPGYGNCDTQHPPVGPAERRTGRRLAPPVDGPLIAEPGFVQGEPPVTACNSPSPAISPLATWLSHHEGICSTPPA